MEPKPSETRPARTSKSGDAATRTPRLLETEGALLGPYDLYRTLTGLLRAVEDEADRIGVDLPDRRYVTTGGAVFDCEQVAVSATSLSPGAPGLVSEGGFSGACASGWSLNVEVAIVRCAQEGPDGPAGELPPRVEWVEADVQSVSVDSSVLVGAIDASLENEVGEPSVSLTFSQPQGGLIAAQASVTMSIWR